MLLWAWDSNPDIPDALTPQLGKSRDPNRSARSPPDTSPFGMPALRQEEEYTCKSLSEFLVAAQPRTNITALLTPHPNPFNWIVNCRSFLQILRQFLYTSPLPIRHSLDSFCGFPFAENVANLKLRFDIQKKREGTHLFVQEDLQRRRQRWLFLMHLLRTDSFCGGNGGSSNCSREEEKRSPR